MKIQAINNQVSSKGIYVDRSNENHRNWKMVYHPYSWELDGEGKPYIAPKNKIDMFASNLPDNEEFFTEIKGNEAAKSEDILGTVSYYQYPPHVNNGEMRSNVILEEPLNREESLETLKRKLSVFKNKKEFQLNYKLANEINIDAIENHHENYQFWSNEYDDQFFNGNDEKAVMDSKEAALFMAAKDLYVKARNYINMNLSIEKLKENIASIKSELDMIKSANENGLAIDISRRTGEDPDRPLAEFLDKVAISEKPLEKFEELIILPNCTRKFKDLLSSLHHYTGSMQLNLQKSGLTDECKKQIMSLTRHIMK